MKISLIFFLLILLSSTTLVVFAQQPPTTTSTISPGAAILAAKQLLQDREDSLNTLVIAAQKALLQKCASVENWTRSDMTCDPPACGNYFPSSFGYECNTKYGEDAELCGSSNRFLCSGLTRSETRSVVVFAPNLNTKDEKAQAFIAHTRLMTSAVTTELQARRLKAWVGYGSATGAHRVWPGNPRERTGSLCSPYDPRLRPWYAAAASGPKDTILVLDSSASLFFTDCRGCQSRLQLLQSAAAAIIVTLTPNDHFAIVTFSDENSGKIITGGGRPVLLQGTDDNKAAAKTAIMNMIPDGATNFESGFSKAFEIFRASSSLPGAATSNCSRAIVFVSDGNPNDDASVDAYVAGQQATLGQQAQIFTFTMSSGASVAKPRSLACANRGLHVHIPNGVNPVTAMGQYYKLLALANPSNASRWTSIYLDNLGLGLMTTCGRPIYDAQSNFVGVLSVDIPIGEFLELGVTQEQLSDLLINRSGSCPNVHFSDCFLQKLRNESGYECPGNLPTFAACLADGNETESTDCAVFLPSSVNPIRNAGGMNALLCEEMDFSTTRLAVNGGSSDYEVMCCDCKIRKGVVAGIVVGCVLFVISVGVGVTIWICFFKKKIAAPKNSSRGEQQQNEVDEYYINQQRTQNNNNDDDAELQQIKDDNENEKYQQQTQNMGGGDLKLQEIFEMNALLPRNNRNEFKKKKKKCCCFFRIFGF